MMYDYFNVFTIFHAALFNFSDYVYMRKFFVWSIYYGFVSLYFNSLYLYFEISLNSSFVTKFQNIFGNNFLSILHFLLHVH